MRVRSSMILAPWLLIAGLGLAASANAATPDPVKIASVDEMPAAVQKTVRAEATGAKIRAMWKEIGEDGKPQYEVEMIVQGLTKDISVAEDGVVLVSEQQMTLAAVPPAVRATILSTAGKRKIKLVESVTKLGKLAYYEAHVLSGKKLTEIVVGTDGVLIP